MADAVLSMTASPLAALFSPVIVDGTGTGVAAADPFANLLATVGAVRPAGLTTAATAPAVTPTLESNSAISGAGAAPILPPAIIPPNGLIASLPGSAPLPSPPLAETLPNLAREMTREGAKSSDAKADSEDPLGDAIASGPNAVLAFVPTIVPIVVAQPAPIPINIDVPPQGLPAAKLATIRASADMPRVAQPTPQPAAEGPAPATMDMDSHSELPNVVSAPSSAPLPAEKLKAEIGSIPQISSIEFQALPALSSDQQPAPVAPADGLSQHIPDGSQIGVSVLESSSVPNTASSRPRGDTLGAARRVAGDPRRRAEPAIADSLPVGLTQRAAETAQAPLADAMTSVDGKGDTIVEQTLNIARDAAWLDTLAHDIAKTAGGDGNLRFKLEPANLGSLTVAIAHGTEGASIHLTADREKTRDILIDAQPKLIAEARAQGLKVSDTHVDLRHQDQPSNQDASRWTQGNNSQNMASQNGQNRNSSPAHQPFVSNLGGKSDAEHESPSGDSDALYA